jgi:hypothetical protein
MSEEEKTPSRSNARRVVIPAVLLLVIFLLAGYLLLPLAAERIVLPAIFKTAGIRDYALPVRGLRPFGMDFGALRIGPEASPGIEVAAIGVRYRPAGLLQGRLSRVTLEGVRIRLVEKPGGGFEVPGLPAAREKAEEGAPPSEELPVTIAQVDVRQGEVIVWKSGRSALIPFEASLRPSPDMKILEGVITLKVPDDEVVVKGLIDMGGNRLQAEWEGRGLRLGDLARLAGVEDLTALSGTGDIRGSLQGSLSPLKIETAHTRLNHTPCRLIWGDVRLDLSGATSTGELQVTVDSDWAGVWDVDTGPIGMVVPGGGEGRFALNGRLETPADGSLTWEGRLNGMVAVDSNHTGRPRAPWPLELKTAAKLSPDGHWLVDLAMIKTGQPASPKATAAGLPPAGPVLKGFTLNAEGGLTPLAADIRWRMSGLDWTPEGLDLSLAAAEGVAHYQRDASTATGTLAVTLGPTTVSAPAGTARLGAIRLSGEGSWASGGAPWMSGEVVVDKGSFALPAMDLRASGFGLRLPLAWPPPGKGKPGSFALSAVTWQKRGLGRVTGQLRQAAEGLTFTARNDSRLVPGLKVKAQGAAGLRPGESTPFARVEWSAERPVDAPPIVVSDFMSKPPEFPITFQGALSARGEALYEGGLQGSLSAGVAAGRLDVDDQGGAIEGIETTLRIPDLKTMRSAPGQVLAFEAASLGGVRADNGRLAYQVEPGAVVFLENGRFQWCGGTVIIPATRFTPGKNVYDVTAFCDRLKLDQLLEQLGLAQVEGGGAISGLIPVTLEDGRLSFNNAFLYSSPGEGGVIRVQGSEVLTAGVPQGTPQYNQMELARYALKDYDYQWAKITMNSVADDLLVQLQFDGKPAGPLPFVYDPEAGGFVKTAPGKPGSVFQGIRLDVNVTLPLNRMLRYRELFKRLQ